MATDCNTTASALGFTPPSQGRSAVSLTIATGIPRITSARAHRGPSRTGMPDRLRLYPR